MRSKRKSKWVIRTGIAMAIFFFALGWIAESGLAAGEKYPEKTIEVVICYNPGATDAAFRVFTDKLPDYLGQPMAFVYKPGAAGSIGASFVSKAKSDGYTLIGTSQSPVIISPLTKEVDYTLDDFVPICQLVKSPIIVAVKSDSPWKSLGDVIKAAKASPGKITFSTAGAFGSTHVPMEMFLKDAGVKMTHIPCKGSTPAVTALLGGHVDLTCSTMAAITPHFKSGALRPIAVFENERLKKYPDVPTFSELHYPVVFSVYYGFMAPKGTSKEIVRTIDEACKKVIKDHMDYLEDRFGKMSLELEYLGPEAYGTKLKEQSKMLKKIVAELKAATK